MAGLLADYFYFQDWWRPITSSGTWISFEGFITALFIGGLSSVIYYLFTKKKESSEKVDFIRELNKKNFFIFIFGLLFLLPAIFFITGKNSFYATNISLSVMILIMFFKRPDLIKNSLISGFALLFVSILVYYIVNKITPGWVENFWISEDTLKMKILSLPVNDYFWYFLGGMYMGPLFEILFDKRY